MAKVSNVAGVLWIAIATATADSAYSAKLKQDKKRIFVHPFP